jgi:hypothetical protein
VPFPKKLYSEEKKGQQMGGCISIKLNSTTTTTIVRNEEADDSDEEMETMMDAKKKKKLCGCCRCLACRFLKKILPFCWI